MYVLGPSGGPALADETSLVKLKFTTTTTRHVLLQRFAKFLRSQFKCAMRMPRSSRLLVNLALCSSSVVSHFLKMKIHYLKMLPLNS